MCNANQVLCMMQTKDQTWTAGNLALQVSMQKKKPVRVIRGSSETVKYALHHDLSPFKAY